MHTSVRAACRLAALIAVAFVALAACAGGPVPGGATPAGRAASATATATDPVASIASLPPAERKAAFMKRGADYEAKGDLAKAYDSYMAADDPVALTLLADKLLAAGSYQLYVLAWREGRRAMAFRDDFADNARAWNVRSDDYGVSTIRDGALSVKRTIGNSNSYFWTEGGLDPDLDFSIEALVTRKAGSMNTLASLAWGIKDADTNFQFGVTGDGSYLFGGYRGGKWKAIVDWKESAAIKKGYAANKLEVRRGGPTLFLYINDQLVDSAPYGGLPGTRVGLCVGTPLEVDVDYYQVEKFPSSREPWNAAGEAALAKSDADTAISCFGNAGNVERLDGLALQALARGGIDEALGALRSEGLGQNGARVRLASFLAGSGRSADSLAQLGLAGWRLDDGFSRPVLREDFKNNARDWSFRDDNEAKLQIADGRYHVESVSDGGRNTWDSVAIDPDADFKIEASVRKLSGPDDQTCSLIWGFKDSSEKQDFGVTGAGGFEYGYFTPGGWTSVLSEAKSPAVRPGNAENVLTVLREGEKLELLVNGNRVGEVPFRKFLGDNIGFAVYCKMAMDVDYLTVTEYPPAFAVELARQGPYASRPDAFSGAVAAMYLDKGRYDLALSSYLAAKDEAGARDCELRLGDQAVANGDASLAVEHYLKAGSSARALRGLAAAYDSLGQADKAASARLGLADLLFSEGMLDKALPLYLALSKPSLLDVAGSRYLDSGDFESAATLFKASGNRAKERDCYGREAEALARSGNVVAAIPLYRKAGTEAKAVQAEKRLTALSPVNLLAPGDTASPSAGGAVSAAAGLRIADSSGLVVDIAQPIFEGDPPDLGTIEDPVEFSLDRLGSATFDWAKGSAVLVGTDGHRSSVPIDAGELHSVHLTGALYQGGVRCAYRIALLDIKLMTRIEIGASKPVDEVAAAPAPRDWRLVDLKGQAYSLTDVGFFYRGSFDSGYNFSGFGEGFLGKCLDQADELSIRLGKGSYAVPLASIQSISLKDKSFITSFGLRCPFAGKGLDLVVLAGDTARGRMAVYPSALAEIVATPGDAAASGAASGAAASGFAPPAGWSVACSGSKGAKPSLSLSAAKSEIYSPDIDWGATDSVLGFRAALADLSELGEPSGDMQGLFWDKTIERESVPILIGETYWAVPFGAIREFGMDAKGMLSILLKDGGQLRGTAYKNWTGLVGATPQGQSRLPRQKIPASVAVLEPGTVLAMGLELVGSIKDTLQTPYGQRGYLAWTLKLGIRNQSGASLAFGPDLAMLEGNGAEAYDGCYVAYASGSPSVEPGHSDFDAEAQAYSLPNFQRWWSDGTMREFRNGGTYSFGDPPDFKAERTLCNSRLSAGASISVDKEFDQGSYVDPRGRVLVALPAIGSGADAYRLVLEFSNPDPGSGERLLSAARAVRLTKDDLLAALASAKGDAALEALALRWLAGVAPAAAAPILERNILAQGKGLSRVQSVQLLAVSGLKPGAEARAAIVAMAGGDDWAARVARRFLGLGE